MEFDIFMSEIDSVLWDIADDKRGGCDVFVIQSFEKAYSENSRSSSNIPYETMMFWCSYSLYLLEGITYQTLALKSRD